MTPQPRAGMFGDADTLACQLSIGWELALISADSTENNL
jgi:hypothetical protein